MESFVLVAYASLAAPRTLLQRLLVYLKFSLDSEDFFCCYNWKKWFLWTMVAAGEVSEDWHDIYDEGYMHQFLPEPTHKIH